MIQYCYSEFGTTVMQLSLLLDRFHCLTTMESKYPTLAKVHTGAVTMVTVHGKCQNLLLYTCVYRVYSLG